MHNLLLLCCLTNQINYIRTDNLKVGAEFQAFGLGDGGLETAFADETPRSNGVTY